MDALSLTLEEERRRRFHTALVLGGALIASTLFVSNQRALFVKLEKATPPVAFAVQVHKGDGEDGGEASARSGRTRSPVARTVRKPRIPLSAFAVRLPEGPQETAAFLPADAIGFPVGARISPLDTGALGDFGGAAFNPFSEPPFGVAVTTQAAQDNPTPAVPEPSAWAMMMLGLGFLGGALRWMRRPSMEDQLVAADRDRTELR